MIITNITFQEYYELEDKTDYNFFLRNGIFDSLDLFNTGDFNELTFGFVKSAQQIVNSKAGLTWDKYFDLIIDLTNKNQKDIAKNYIFQLHMNRLYIVKEVEKINLMENRFLSHASDADEVSAGLSEFEKFGAFLQFDKLAGGNILKIEEIKSLPYDFCFTKLYLETEKSKFQSRLSKMKSKKK